jgi:hypothetical protein
MKRLRAALLTALALSIPSVAAAQKPKPRPPAPAKPPPPAPTPAPTPPTADKPGTVAVSVIEVAGGNAYVKPGAAGGVRRNSRVTIEGRQYTVVASTTNFATIELGDSPAPREQASGTATVVSEEEEKPKELPPPRPPEQLRGQWAEWHAPAESQHPKPVPLGLPDHDRRYDVLVYGYAGVLDSLGGRGGGYVRGEVGARMHLEPFSAPLSLDVDGSVQRWFGSGIYDRDGARPTLRVRELQLGYGNPSRYFAGLGRIRYAAATLGTLDGLRARAPLGDFWVSAFGGLLPDPLQGSFSTESQRFGVELGFSKAQIDLRPEASLVVHSSTYEGKLDERRISGVVNIYPGKSRAGAHFELSAFDKNNPWGVSPLELSAAGVDGTLRFGAWQLGARADMRQQERSRYLAAYLPASWFCVRVPGPPAAAGGPPNPDVCDPKASTLYQLGVDAGFTAEHFSMFVAGLTSHNPFVSKAPSQEGLFANLRVLKIWKGLRVDGSGTASTGTYMDIFSGTLGPGISAFGDRLDLSVYYRYTAMRYRVGESLNMNAIGGYATILPANDLVLALQTEGTGGDDVGALMGTLVVVYRPRF